MSDVIERQNKAVLLVRQMEIALSDNIHAKQHIRGDERSINSIYTIKAYLVIDHHINLLDISHLRTAIITGYFHEVGGDKSKAMYQKF